MSNDVAGPDGSALSDGLGPLEAAARRAGMYFAKDDFGDVPEIEATLPQLSALVDSEVSAERERWKAALRCDGTCPPCLDPKNCKREAVGLPMYLPGG